MDNQFKSIAAFENEVGLTLRALEDLVNQEGAVRTRYSKLEAECKQGFEERKREAEKERLREASAANGRSTDQERRAHEQYASDLKELTTGRRKQTAALEKERERRRLTLETSRDSQVNEARQRASEEVVRLQESVGKAEVEAENRIMAFAETFKQEYDTQLSNDVRDYLVQVKTLTGAVMAEGHRLEREREQIVGQTSNLLDHEAKNAEEIRRLAGEIEAYVQGIPRTFNEHSALHTPFRLNRGHNVLPAPFNSTAEARRQMKSRHAEIAAISTKILSLNTEVDENRAKAVATMVVAVVVAGLVLLILVFLGALLFRS